MNKTRVATLSGNSLGALKRPHCRWIYMGNGTWQWVCFAGGDTSGGSGIRGFGKAVGPNLPAPNPNDGAPLTSNIIELLKQYWYIPAALIAYFVFVK